MNIIISSSLKFQLFDEVLNPECLTLHLLLFCDPFRRGPR